MPPKVHLVLTLVLSCGLSSPGAVGRALCSPWELVPGPRGSDRGRFSFLDFLEGTDRTPFSDPQSWRPAVPAPCGDPLSSLLPHARSPRFSGVWGTLNPCTCPLIFRPVEVCELTLQGQTSLREFPEPAGSRAPSSGALHLAHPPEGAAAGE